MLSKRYQQVVIFFARLLAGLAIWEIILPRLGLKKWAQSGREARLKAAAGRFRNMAIRMGGVWIKLGQFFSTRVDVLPAVITQELAGLQDEVPPEDFAAIRRVAETEYKMALEEKFASFDPQPLAAASLGQVHLARLWPEDVTGSPNEPGDLGEPPDDRQDLEVVVKIQRPNIEKIIDTDLAALRTVGDWLRRYRPISLRADVPALLAEFTRILYEEIDYVAEGHNAETFAANFQDLPEIWVPRVIWSHTTKRALTLENVTGIKITDYASIERAGIDRGEVANRLLDTYLKQIFEDGFFHADPHPGNLFVHPEGKNEAGETEWRLTFIDFGMVGHIPANTRQALREMLVAVGTKDAARIIRSYQMLGVLLPSADVKLLERATARMFEQFWGKSMTELREISPKDVMKLAHGFENLLYELPFQVPQNLIFLGRAVAILSGMCTGLNPDFNVWYHLAPYAQKLIKEEGSGLWWKELSSLLEKLIALPRRTEAILEKVEQGELSVRDPQLTDQVKRLEKSVQGAGLAVMSTGLFIGGVQFYLHGDQPLAIGAWSGAFLLLLWYAFGQRRPKS